MGCAARAGMSTPSSPGGALRPVVLAAVDASEVSEPVIQRAALLATAMGATLHVAHVVDGVALAAITLGGSPLLMPNSARLIQQGWQTVERLCAPLEDRGQDVAKHVLVGEPRVRLLQLATDLEAEVLVIGTHDPGKAALLLFGSVASELARKAPCAVFVVRARRHSHPDVPEIEPPCPDCLKTRAASGGQALWCERHNKHHTPLPLAQVDDPAPGAQTPRS